MPPPLPDTPGQGGLATGLLHDLRYAVRMLRKQPGFAIAAVLTLALGIGANTAVFSLVNATLFQRLPVPDRERLVYVNRGPGGVFSYPQYETLRDDAPSFEALAGWGGITASLHARVGGARERLHRHRQLLRRARHPGGRRDGCSHAATTRRRAHIPSR